MTVEELLDALIRSAEATSAQASGNDKTDWNNFASALRRVRDSLPKPTPQKG